MGESLSSAIDKLYKARTALKKHKVEEEEALAFIKEQNLEPDVTYHGTKATLKVSERAITDINTMKVHHKLKLVQFLQVVKVTKAKLEKYFTKPEIDSVTEITGTTLVYTTKEKE